MSMKSQAKKEREKRPPAKQIRCYRIDPEIDIQIREIALREGVSESMIVRAALEDWLKRRK